MKVFELSSVLGVLSSALVLKHSEDVHAQHHIIEGEVIPLILHSAFMITSDQPWPGAFDDCK